MRARRRPPSPAPEPAVAPGEGNDAPLHRSGAVAAMLRMPVATLRIWERRYGLTRPAQSAGGQRLYSAADVRRLTLLKQLTDLGHAIGSLAPLDLPQLQRVAATHARATAATQTATRATPATPPPARPWRLAVVGAALAMRLQRPALLRRLGRPLALLGPYADAAQAAAALQGADVDALLLHEPQLQPGWLQSLEAAAPSLARLPKAVFYGFAADPVCEALATADTALLREPQPDAVLAQWLHQLSQAAPANLAPGHGPGDAAASPGATSPRRWDAAGLVGFAGLASTVACECPRHVAELLTQLSEFEDYSAGCAHRNAADAELHARLQQVAAAARTLFEAALEQVALHEGLLLPPAAGAGSVAAGANPVAAVAAAPARRPRRRG